MASRKLGMSRDELANIVSKNLDTLASDYAWSDRQIAQIKRTAPDGQ
jgi:hypothetical protein